MSIYPGIGNMAKATSKLYLGVNGKARQLSKIYLGVGGTAKLVYASGTPLGSLAVGTEIGVEEDRFPWTWVIVHQGVPNSTIYDSSCRGTWLMRLATPVQNITWESSNVRKPYDENTYAKKIADEYFNKFSPDVQACVKTANIPIEKNKTKTTCSVKTFIPDVYELFPSPTGIATSIDVHTGALLDYFKDTSTANSRRKTWNENGDKCQWWTRTWSNKGWTYLYNCAVGSTGDQYYQRIVDSSVSMTIRPFMICDPDAVCDEDLMLLGM